MPEAYIYDTLRTPRGRGVRGGALYEVKPADLLAAVLNALCTLRGLDTALVDDVLIGCVTPIDDQGGDIARAALLHAGWPREVGGMQLSRAGASGLEAVNLAAAKVRSGWERLVVAGGVESLSRVPAGSDGGALVFDPEIINGVGCVPQGVAADLLATLEGLDRGQLDAYALRSFRRAVAARDEGRFSRALVPIHDRNGLLLLAEDELLCAVPAEEALPALAPAFAVAGGLGFDELALQRYPHLERIRHVHTEGNIAAVADGAAVVLVGSREAEAIVGRAPRARIRAQAVAGVDPTLLLSGPAPAARRALDRAGMTPADIDLWECNETFAAVPLTFQRALDIDDERLNVNGGVIALGHPRGATGAMLVGALLDELERRDLNTGLVVLAAAGGMAVATVLERV